LREFRIRGQHFFGSFSLLQDSLRFRLILPKIRV
jgi:hypothetical protein